MPYLEVCRQNFALNVYGSQWLVHRYINVNKIGGYSQVCACPCLLGKKIKKNQFEAKIVTSRTQVFDKEHFFTG